MNAAVLKKQILSGEWDQTLTGLYGSERLPEQKARYLKTIDAFTELFGDREELRIFSAPGRTEICGNHTDHNHGKVVAASVNLDVIAVAAKSDTGLIRVQSKGYPMNLVDLSVLDPQSSECNHSSALLRGVAAGFSKNGHTIGGFDAYTVSDVLKGSGLSSSAAFEVLAGTILNGLYNADAVSPVEIAQIAQYAENEYFGKPSGLMDQMASAVGGVITIDFYSPACPIINQLPLDVTEMGCALCIVDTGGNHADLTDEYAAIPAEMKQVAALFGEETLRPLSEEALLTRSQEIRTACGDRALLRAIHYLRENKRVERLIQALEEKDYTAFFAQLNESGRSSFCYLQNVYPASHPKEQGLSLALAVADSILGNEGARRVHGGGFGGTTQNFVPFALVDAFRKSMESVFGTGSCHILSIRSCGGIEVSK